MRVTSPLGPDALLIERLSAVEAVSSPFEYTLDLLSTNASINPKDVLRKAMTVAVEVFDFEPAAEQRYLHGIVRRFVQGGRSQGLTSYRAEVVPAFWFLSLSSNCRIFQNMSVPDIIKKVLSAASLTDTRFALTGTYEAREYCVQYRESDFAFVSRLMEEEGIFYFFEHTESKHVMVFADVTTAIKPGILEALPVTSVEAGADQRECITEFEIDSELVSGKFALTDHNFETPNVTLQSTIASGAGTLVEDFRNYDYPGNFRVKAAGDRLARLRLEESETFGKMVNAATNYRGLCAGQKLGVAEHYRDDANADYHVVATQHTAVEGSYRSAVGSEPPFEFTTRFQAIPFTQTFRPPRVTPKSVVHGSQTAVVVGKSGEEIWVDKYGRVKVQFFWDEVGQKDEHSSCWVRVSSTWAGKQWGFIQIPRIGQEVVVGFLEGDPDRPIITGSVYNAEQMPPYTLPANMTQSGILSRSTKGGGAADANEFRFEDKKGSEQILLHAQKDLLMEVENDETRTVDHDRTTTIKNDETLTVDHDRTTTIKNNETLTVTTGNRAVTIKTGNESLTVETGNVSIKIDKGNQDTKVSMGNVSTEVSMGNVSTKVSMGNVSTDVDMGNVALKAALGAINNEAMQGIELKVGQSSIKVDQMGVTIKGMMIKIEGQIQTDIKGLMTNVKADAMLMVKGAITMIN